MRILHETKAQSESIIFNCNTCGTVFEEDIKRLDADDIFPPLGIPYHLRSYFCNCPKCGSGVFTSSDMQEALCKQYGTTETNTDNDE